MDTLINQIVNQLDLDPSQAKTAIGAILRFCRTQAAEVDNFDFDAFLTKLPGSESLLQTEKNYDVTTQQQSNAVLIIGLLTWFLKAFGIMEILKTLLTRFFGDSAVKLLDSAGDGAELASVFRNLGINREQGTKMVAMFVDYAKLKAGPVVIDKLLESIPALQTFLGGGGNHEKDE
jgi:hypothetical protein